MTTVFHGERPVAIESWLDQRRSLGQDRYDEVREGSYHVVPGPSLGHATVDRRLGVVLERLAERAGLSTSTAFNLGDPQDFRVPDGGVHRGVAVDVFIPTAAAVVEILGPGDETFTKFSFYAGHGVEEIVVADPSQRTVRIWWIREGDGDAGYDETGRSELLGITGSDLAAGIDWP